MAYRITGEETVPFSPDGVAQGDLLKSIKEPDNVKYVRLTGEWQSDCTRYGAAGQPDGTGDGIHVRVYRSLEDLMADCDADYDSEGIEPFTPDKGTTIIRLDVEEVPDVAEKAPIPPAPVPGPAVPEPVPAEVPVEEPEAEVAACKHGKETYLPPYTGSAGTQKAQVYDALRHHGTCRVERVLGCLRSQGLWADLDDAKALSRIRAAVRSLSSHGDGYPVEMQNEVTCVIVDEREMIHNAKGPVPLPEDYCEPSLEDEPAAAPTVVDVEGIREAVSPPDDFGVLSGIAAKLDRLIALVDVEITPDALLRETFEALQKTDPQTARVVLGAGLVISGLRKGG